MGERSSEFAPRRGLGHNVRLLLSPLLVLLSVVCCSDGNPPGTHGADSAALSAAAVPIEVVDLAGIEAALARQKGRALLVNFWATWCPPCVAELPELMEVAGEYRSRGADVLGVSFDLMIPGVERAETAGMVREFLTERDLALTTLIYDAPDYDSINERFDLPGAIPVTLAFDADGELVDRHAGQASAERFEEMMRKALGL